MTLKPSRYAQAAAKPKAKPKRPAKPAPAPTPSDAPDAAYAIREIRYRALLASIEAAKLGLAHDVYQTADKYAAWLGGGSAEAPTLPFGQRLRDLVDECLKSGEVDRELVLHEMQVILGIPVTPPAAPDWAGGNSAADAAVSALKEGRI
jgi:hypothetical protein